MRQDFKHSLDKSSRKFPCPGCGKRRFVRYKDNSTGSYLSPEFGRCDRENNCGYHHKPGNVKSLIPLKYEEPKLIAVDFLPKHFLLESIQPDLRAENHFFTYLTTLFGFNAANQLFDRYKIGSSSQWRGGTAFWQIDPQGNVRQTKSILYNPQTGKRIKEGELIIQFDNVSGEYRNIVAGEPCSKVNGRYLSKETQNLNLQQIFFGSHLLAENKGKKVCIVESEKTAIIASFLVPQYVWLATGGASGCKWTEYIVHKILKGRDVTLFPDHGYFSKPKSKPESEWITCFNEWERRANQIKLRTGINIKASNLLERKLQYSDRADQDLADVLFNKDNSTGIAINNFGYPLNWDNYKTNKQ